MRRDELDAGAFAFRFPQGFRRFDAFGLREHIFREDDAVATLFIAADRHGNIFQRRVIKRLHRGIKVIHIDVQNDPIHGFCLLSARYEHAFSMLLL
jgi:hypothetical protein